LQRSSANVRPPKASTELQGGIVNVRHAPVMKGKEKKMLENEVTDGDSELKSDEKSLVTNCLDTDSERDLFEESFQDLDFLSHIESIEESQNSVDATDTKNIIVSSKQVTSGQVRLSFDSITHEKPDCLSENSIKENPHCDSICDIKSSETLRTSKVRTESSSTMEDLEKVVNAENVGSLRDRLKRKLLQNVGGRSPVSPGLTVEQGRQNQMKEAELQAAIIREEGSADDIGPFYGLPSKVQQLLQDLRGITSLYGNSCFLHFTVRIIESVVLSLNETTCLIL
jgi:hypothetical protein